MTRRQLIGFVVVLALIGGGLLLRGASAPRSSSSSLTALRASAALDRCPPGVGSALPDLRLGCLGGGADVELRAKGPGRPMLVNIWATWCSPCVREVPNLVGFASKAGGRVGVLGVDTEDESDKALTFASQYAMHYPSLVDEDGKVLRAYGSGPPITLLVDAGGQVVFTHRGELHSVAEIEQLVEEHLGVRL